MKTALLVVVVAALAPPVFAESGGPARQAHFHRPDDAPLKRFERIVSLAPVVTEALFLLGAGERVVGVTRYCDRPAAARDLPAVGGFTDPQLEVIAALKPDLVVAMPSLGQRRVLDLLRDRGVAVLVVFADTTAEVDDLVTQLGVVLGAADRASAILSKQRAALRKLDQVLVGRPRVLVLVAVRPLVAAGPGTFIDEALRRLGAQPVLATGPAWPTLSWEVLVETAPEAIVVAEGPSARARLSRALKARWPRGKKPPRVLSGDEQILMRPGPTLHEDIARLAALLKP